MMNNKSRTVKLVLLIWFAALALTGVVAPNYTRHQRFCIICPEKWQHRLSPVMNECNTNTGQYLDISTFSQFVPFILAFFPNTIMYALIIPRLSQRDVSSKGDDKTGLKVDVQKMCNAVAIEIEYNKRRQAHAWLSTVLRSLCVWHHIISTIRSSVWYSLSHSRR